MNKKTTIYKLLTEKVIPSLKYLSKNNIIIDQKEHSRRVDNLPLFPIYDPKEHYHHYFEMCYLVDNECYLNLDGISYRIAEGDICIVPPSEKHCEMGLKKNKEFRIMWFVLEGSRLRINLMADRHKNSYDTVDHLDVEIPIYLLNLLPFILMTYRQNQPRWVDITKGAFLSLFSYVADLAEKGGSETGATWHEKILGETIEYLNANYNRDLGLDEIARKMGFSPNYFSSLFKEYCGVSIFEYINKIRVEKAKELLKDPKYRVKEISYMLGYSSQYYFSTVFKKLTKTSPEKYRLKKRRKIP